MSEVQTWDSDEERRRATEPRRYEGWDDSTGDPDTVRRFAIPPYRWVTVEKSRFPGAVGRETSPEADRAAAGPGRQEESQTRAWDIDELVEEADWEHDYGRTPYENTIALARALPDDTPDGVIVEASFKFIMGMGRAVTPRAIEYAREREDLPEDDR